MKVLGVRGFFVVSGTLEQRIGAIARLQRGRITRRQLRCAGVHVSAVDRMLRRGLLHREYAGVYAVGWEGPVPLARETSALLASGEDAVLSHRSAGALWNLIPEAVGPVEITIARDRAGGTRAGIVRHRTAQLLPRDVRTHRKLPVTSPARTLLDLAEQLPTEALGRAVDEALVVLKIAGPSDVRDVLERASGRRGAAILAQLMDRRTPAGITQSEAERMFLKLVRDAGLPEPLTQVQLAGFRVDFFWPEHRVVFEVDGYRYHTSRTAFDRDRRKDAALKNVDVDPNRVSRDQVKYEPFAVVAHVAAALARAAVHRPATAAEYRRSRSPGVQRG